MKTDVLEFKDLVSFHEGKFVKEKTYHLNLQWNAIRICIVVRMAEQ